MRPRGRPGHPRPSPVVWQNNELSHPTFDIGAVPERDAGRGGWGPFPPVEPSSTPRRLAPSQNPL